MVGHTCQPVCRRLDAARVRQRGTKTRVLIANALESDYRHCESTVHNEVTAREDESPVIRSSWVNTAHATANREIHPANPAGWRRVGTPGGPGGESKLEARNQKLEIGKARSKKPSAPCVRSSGRPPRCSPSSQRDANVKWTTVERKTILGEVALKMVFLS